MTEFVFYPNAAGNTATYEDGFLDQLESKLGKQVELLVIETVPPEPIPKNDPSDPTEEQRFTEGEYSAAVVSYPSRDAIESYYTLKDRFPIKAHEALLKDMLIPGHYDAEIVKDDKVFMATMAPVMELTMVKRGLLKKRARNGASSHPTTGISTERPAS